jgi:hypothetical protein
MNEYLLLCVGLLRGSLHSNGIGDEGGAALVRALRAHPGALVSLVGVDLCKCDPDLPLELQQAYNTAILKYYRDLATHAPVVSRRCRVMLLGTGGVGKTTLAHRLVTGGPGERPVHVTHGVLQRRWQRTAALPRMSPERCPEPCLNVHVPNQTTG